MCSIFALREIPDLNTKQTRITSVVYSTTEDQTATTENKKNHHKPVLLNTNKRDSCPYASPERPVTAPSGKCQRRSTVRPLGAAMRLTASSQPPKDITRPKQTRQPKQIPNLLKNTNPHHPNDCNYASSEAGKHRNAGIHFSPYAVRGPTNTDTHFLPDTPTFSTGICQRILPHLKPNKHLPSAPLPTDAQHQLGSACVGRPGIGIRLCGATYGGTPGTIRELALPNLPPGSTTPNS